MEQISIAEPLASSGETVLSPQAWEHVVDIVVEGEPIAEQPTFKRYGYKQRNFTRVPWKQFSKFEVLIVQTFLFWLFSCRQIQLLFSICFFWFCFLDNYIQYIFKRLKSLRNEFHTYPTVKTAAQKSDTRYLSKLRPSQMAIPRRYIPRNAWKQIENGTLSYVNEMRICSVIFIQVAGLKVEENPELADLLMKRIQVRYPYETNYVSSW